jgi:hypothetical protein
VKWWGATGGPHYVQHIISVMHYLARPAMVYSSLIHKLKDTYSVIISNLSQQELNASLGVFPSNSPILPIFVRMPTYGWFVQHIDARKKSADFSFSNLFTLTTGMMRSSKGNRPIRGLEIVSTGYFDDVFQAGQCHFHYLGWGETILALQVLREMVTLSAKSIKMLSLLRIFPLCDILLKLMVNTGTFRRGVP